MDDEFLWFVSSHCSLFFCSRSLQEELMSGKWNTLSSYFSSLIFVAFTYTSKPLWWSNKRADFNFQFFFEIFWNISMLFLYNHKKSFFCFGLPLPHWLNELTRLLHSAWSSRHQNLSTNAYFFSRIFIGLLFSLSRFVLSAMMSEKLWEFRKTETRSTSSILYEILTWLMLSAFLYHNRKLEKH